MPIPFSQWPGIDSALKFLPESGEKRKISWFSAYLGNMNFLALGNKPHQGIYSCFTGISIYYVIHIKKDLARS